MTSGKKSLVLILATAVGMCAAFGSYEYLYSQLTPWQANQNISFQKNTGATKFKARVNAATVGLGAFGITACASLLVIRISNKKSAELKK